MGVAIKILLTKRPELLYDSISREDIVSLVNAFHKFSESISLSNELLSMYYKDLATTTASAASVSLIKEEQKHVVSELLHFISENKEKMLRIEEDALVHAVVNEDEKIMLLAQHFSEWTFVRHALVQLSLQSPDVVVVGGGLAGLVTAISVADRGGSVVVIDKQPTVGGT